MIKFNKKFNNRLLKQGLTDSSYYLIANIGSKLFGFLVIPILIRNVSNSDFANYDLFLVISNFLQVFIILGIDSGVAILIAESKNQIKQLSFLYVFALFISICMIVILVLIIQSYFVFYDRLFSLTYNLWVMIIFYVLFNAINYHTFNFLRWEAKAKQAATINMFSYLSGVSIGLILLFFIDKKIENYLIGLIIGSGMASIFSLYISKDYIKNFSVISNAKVLIKELMKLSVPYIPNYIGNNLIQIIDRMLILFLFGKNELGIYAVIIRLAQVPQFLFVTISGGFRPIMYKNYTTEHGVSLIKNFFHIYLILIPIFFILAYIFSDTIINLFAGNDYANYSYLFPIALVSLLFVNSVYTNGLGFSIKRKTYLIVYITFISVFVNILLSFVFGKIIGIIGIILGTLLAGIVRTYLYTKFSEKLYCFGYNFRLFYIVAFLVIIFSLFDYWSYD